MGIKDNLGITSLFKIVAQGIAPKLLKEEGTPENAHQWS
jgi:hypothetical protein